MSLLNNKGFSLIEVLMVVGMLGGLSVAFMKLTDNNIKATKTYETKNDMVAFKREINNLLSHPDACVKSLGGLDPVYTATGLSITQLIDKEGNPKYKQDIRMGSVKITGYMLNDGLPYDIGNEVSVTATGGDTNLIVFFDRGRASLTQDSNINIRIKIISLTTTKSISECAAAASGETGLWDRSSVDQDDIFYNSGDVGIGTVAPSQLLHVSKNDASLYLGTGSGVGVNAIMGDGHLVLAGEGNVAIIADSNGGTLPGGTITLGGGNTGTYSKTSASSTLWPSGLPPEANDKWMTITNGKVGIGAITPVTQFTNSSTTIITDGTYSVDASLGFNWRGWASDTYIAGLSNTKNNGGGLLIRSGDATVDNNISKPLHVMNDAPGNTLFTVRNDGDAYFSGNVGIGVSDPKTKLQVKGGGIAMGGGAALFGNMYYSGGWKHIENGYGGYIKFPKPSGSPLTNGGISMGIATVVGVADGVATIDHTVLRIQPTGEVGIGTQDPATKLEVVGTVRATRYDIGGSGSSIKENAVGEIIYNSVDHIFQGMIDMNGRQIKIGEFNAIASGPDIQFKAAGLMASEASMYINIDSSNTTNTAQFQIRKNSNKKNGTSIAIFTVKEAGNVWSLGTANHASDKRLKKDITNLKGSAENIYQLSGKHFYWKDKDMDQEKQTGFIAQEVQKLFPELVSEDEETGFLSLNYTGFIPHLVETVKEQKKEIDNLRRENLLIKEALCEMNPVIIFCK